MAQIAKLSELAVVVPIAISNPLDYNALTLFQLSQSSMHFCLRSLSPLFIHHAIYSSSISCSCHLLFQFISFIFCVTMSFSCCQMINSDSEWHPELKWNKNIQKKYVVCPIKCNSTEHRQHNKLVLIIMTYFFCGSTQGWPDDNWWDMGRMIAAVSVAPIIE